MQYCVDFNKKVVEVLSFSRDMNNRFKNMETKYQRTPKQGLSFGEILDEVIKESKERK